MRCTIKDILKVSRVLDDDSVFIPVNGKPCDDEGAAAYQALTSGAYVLMPNKGSVFIYIPLTKIYFRCI